MTIKATINGSLQARPKGIHARKSLGPVANLEEYVNPEWWSTIFNNSLHLKTDADVAEDQPHGFDHPAPEGLGFRLFQGRRSIISADAIRKAATAGCTAPVTANILLIITI